MRAGAKCGPRVYFQHHRGVPGFRFVRLPAWPDQDVVDTEAVEVVFPVVDPVFFPGYGFLDAAASDIHRIPKRFQTAAQLFQQAVAVRIFFHVK